uniref:Uncharacterized protein n=1 Tax=Amphimedon queenslandica TaxID=400682 RepID=A0A1X7US21_AMPQE
MQYSQPGTLNRLPPVDETGDDSAMKQPHKGRDRRPPPPPFITPPPPRLEDRCPNVTAADCGRGGR